MKLTFDALSKSFGSFTPKTEMSLAKPAIKKTEKSTKTTTFFIVNKQKSETQIANNNHY